MVIYVPTSWDGNPTKDIPDRVKFLNPKFRTGGGRFGTIASGIAVAARYGYRHRKAILGAFGIATGTGVVLNETIFKKQYQSYSQRKALHSGYTNNRRRRSTIHKRGGCCCRC
jgi:hypothetical protein